MSSTLALGCTIDVQAEMRLGESLLVTGTLHNSGPSGVWILPWGTFLDGPTGNYIRVERGGVRMPYDGVFFRHRRPEPEDFVYLGPGEVRSGTIDVSEAYAIGKPGDYDVAFELRLRVAEGSADAAPRDTGRERVEVRSPTARIRIVAGAAPRPTAAQRMRAAETEPDMVAPIPSWTPPKSPIPPQIIGSTDSEMTDQIHLAWDRAYQASVKAWNLLQGLLKIPNPQNGTYQTWFGTYSTANAQTVLGTFALTLQAMSNPKAVMQIRVGAATTGCTSTTYGYGGYHSNYIGLCDALFASTLSAWINWTDWDDERMITVVHEMSHVGANTSDGEYGEDATAELAASNPALAVKTADNYGYFALAVEGSYQEPGNGVWAKDKNPFSASMQGRAGAAATASGGSLMLAWQDSSSWLWVNELNLSKGGWGPKTKLANPASSSKYRVTASGPALAAIGNTFYLIFVDGDSKSPTFNALLGLQSSDFGLHWSAQAVVVSAPGSPVSPSLVSAPDGNLYGIFTGAGGALFSVQGIPAADGNSVAWNPPVALGITSAGEPTLCCHAGSFYLASVSSGGALQFRISQDFVSWTPGPVLPLSTSSSAPALSSWSAPGQSSPWLMCLYRGVEPDRHLYYTICDGNLWGVPVREAQNLSKAGPALAAFGPTLYAFHQGSSSNGLWWSSTLPPKALAAVLGRGGGQAPVGGD